MTRSDSGGGTRSGRGAPGLTRREFLRKAGSTAVLLGGASVIGLDGIAAERPGTEHRTRAFRFAHVTDMHVSTRGRDGAAMKKQSRTILEDVVDQLNRIDPLDFCLFGGDNFDNSEVGRKDADAFVAIVKTLKAPYLIQFGNRGASSLPPGDPVSKNAFVRMFAGHGFSGTAYWWGASPVQGVRVLGLDTSIVGHNDGAVPGAQIAWLKKELGAHPDHTVIVLTHHLFLPTWAPRHIPKWQKNYVIANAAAVMPILNASRNVKLVLSGHHHVTKVTPAGDLPYVASPATVQFPCAFRTVEVRAGRARLTFHQVRDKKLEIDPRAIARVSPNQSIPKLRDKPPVRARSEQSAQKTQKAVAAVKSILDGLTSSESGLPQSLTRFAAKCRELDWTQAAGEADALVASIKVGPNLAESVDKVLVSKGHADRGLVLIDGLQAFGEKAQALDDQELVQAAEAARNGLGTLSDKSLAELSAALTAMSAEAAKAGGAWLEKVTGEEEISSSPALNALWKERRAQRLLEAKGHVAAGELTQWLSVSQKLVAVRSLLSAIDDEAQLPPGAPEALDEFSVKEWPIALGAALAAKREAVVTQLAGEALKSHEGEPVTGEELKGRDQWKTACEEYARWRSDGVRTLQDLFAIRTLLEGCYLLDETGAGDEKTILQLLQDCQGRPVFGAEQVEVLAAPIAERVGLLREIGALADRKALIARAQSVEPERPWVASRAVWLKLRGAKDPVWPHGAEEQALEEELVKRLWAGYGKFPDDVRRAVLQVELRRAEIADQSRALTKRNAGLKDKILAAVPACVQGVYTKTGETPPPDQLKVLDTLRKTLQDVLAAAIEIENGKIDRALFQETGSVYQSFAGEVSPQLLSQWVAELKGFRLLAEDPRGKRDEWTSALVKKRKSLDNLARLSASSSVPTKQEVQALEAQYQKAQETVDKLWRVPAVAREKAAIEKLKTQAGSELDALGDALAKSIASAEPPDAWRKRMLKVQTVSASQVLDAIWLERRDQITGSLDQKSSDTDWGAYAEARARMERLKAFLVGLDDRDHLPLPDAALTEETRKKLGTALAEVLTKAILEQREASLKQSAEAALKGGEVPAMGMAEFRKQKQWTESCATYRQWIDDAAGLLVTIESIRRATDEGWPLDAKPDGGKDHIRGMYETALGSQALKQPTIAAAVKPVADGVERLKSIAAEKDRSELVAVTKEAATDGPDFGLAAWRRLGVLAKQPWPSDLAEMTQETEIHSRVLARVSGRADSATKERLLKELLTESARRWQKGFNRLLPTDIAPAVGLLEKLGLKAADVDPFAKRLGPAENLLGPQAQYNLLLQQALVSKSPADEGVPPVCKQFVQAVKQKLPALATNKSVGVFTQALEALGRGEEVGDGDLTKAGPSVSRFGEWKTEIHDEGRSVDYVWKHGGTTHRLHFVKMEASGEVKKSFYLAATEAPLRLFADVISSSGRWDDFEKLLPGHEGIAGPLCWQQDKVGRKIEERAEWVRQTVKLAIKPGAKRETPADGCPIHWISASSAICFSRLLGCRLPSSTEWRQVYAKHRIEQAKAQPNLRDKSWDGERATISWTAKSSPSQALHLEWPDDGVFWPSNIGWAARKEQEKAVPVTENDDGTVWFAPVSSSGTGIFKHLVGNVAELAFEQPESLEQLSDLSATSAGGFVAKNVAHFRVIGGSALSPAEVKADQPYAMDLTQATQGRSDVGLRLAFTAPKQTPSQRLKALLDPPPYLTAAD